MLLSILEPFNFKWRQAGAVLPGRLKLSRQHVKRILRKYIFNRRGH